MYYNNMKCLSKSSSSASRGYHTRHGIRGSRVQTRPGSMDFSERENPEYDFLTKGSKALAAVS